MRFERSLAATNEVFLPDGAPRPVYREVLAELERAGPGGWQKRLDRAHRLLLDEQHSFGLADGDKTHPTDWVPRIIPAADWTRLESGASQRLRAINEFLRRLESGTEEIVPREVLETSILYDTGTPNRFGPVPVRQISFDIVAVEGGRDENGIGLLEYLVIEENAKMPVGLAPMSRRRQMSREVFFPESYAELPVRSLDGWLARLGDALRAAAPDSAHGEPSEATLAVVSSGPEDQFYLDHHIYAAEMGAILAEPGDLGFDEAGYLIHRATGRRIDVVYERVDEDRLYAELPRLLESHLEGKVHVLFAPNSEVIDDKGVYPFVPEMIRTYLGEEPIISNAKTYSLALDADREYVMDRFGELVIKSRGGYGGKEVLIGPSESPEMIEKFRREVEKNPVEYIAQELIDFSTHVLCEPGGNELKLRDSHADYRLLAIAPDPADPSVAEVAPGSLSRVAAPGKYIVNISSGGKMKDTWVLER